VLSREQLTGLPQASGGDDGTALDRLLIVTYDWLRRPAPRRLRRERPNHTLQPTAPVGEAHLPLACMIDTRWRNRAHFYIRAASRVRSRFVGEGVA
jgi:hypothetical protein